MILTAFAALALASGQVPPPTPQARAAWGFDRSDLAPDPRIRFGVLANGMRYAILPNRTPPGTVAFRLLIRVGAADGRPGEAHYLEHMAFMGSRRVPEGARAGWSGASGSGSATISTPIPGTPTLITGSIFLGRTGRGSSGHCCCSARSATG